MHQTIALAQAEGKENRFCGAAHWMNATAGN
jgi:hypothetical protein